MGLGSCQGERLVARCPRRHQPDVGCPYRRMLSNGLASLHCGKILLRCQQWGSYFLVERGAARGGSGGHPVGQQHKRSRL